MAIDPLVIEELGQYSTPSVLNGLKRLGCHPADFESLDRSIISCMSPTLGPRVGFAATRTLATSRFGSTQAQDRSRDLMRRAEDDLLSLPEPRILVAHNVGDWRGPVCIWGEVAANMNLAMGCAAGITNGPVRDLDEMETAGFQTFAGGPGVGGGFVDLLAASEPVAIAGVTIKTGDLLHGDRHGVAKIPLELAERLPEAIRAVEEFERGVVEMCRQPGFTPQHFHDAYARSLR